MNHSACKEAANKAEQLFAAQLQNNTWILFVLGVVGGGVDPLAVAVDVWSPVWEMCGDLLLQSILALR